MDCILVNISKKLNKCKARYGARLYIEIVNCVVTS